MEGLLRKECDKTSSEHTLHCIGPPPASPTIIETLRRNQEVQQFNGTKDARQLQVTACKTSSPAGQTAEATATLLLSSQRLNAPSNKGKTIQRSSILELKDEGITKTSVGIVSRPHPLRAKSSLGDGQSTSNNLSNGELLTQSHKEVQIQTNFATELRSAQLHSTSRIDILRQVEESSQGADKAIKLPEQKRLHQSAAKRLVSRLLPFVRFQSDLWVRFDVRMDAGVRSRWPSQLEKINFTLLKENVDRPWDVGLEMAGTSHEEENMEPTVLFKCERKDLETFKKILKNSPFIEDACKLRFIEATPRTYSAGIGLSTALRDWKSLFVEAYLSNTGHLCGVKARAFDHANLYTTKAFTAGGIILINGCCYLLTTGHCLLQQAPPALVSSDDMDLLTIFEPGQQKLGAVHACEFPVPPNREQVLAESYKTFDWALIEVPRKFWVENRIVLPRVAENVEKIVQDDIDPVDDSRIVPIVGYKRSDQLSTDRVWIATTSGVAQQGFLSQNIAYVFIDGSGIHVRSILLQTPLANGDSGAWVIQDGKLCGYIYGGIEDSPWAYMIPIDTVFDRISNVSEGHHPVQVPSQSEIAETLNEDFNDRVMEVATALPAEFDLSQSSGPEVSTSNANVSRKPRPQISQPSSNDIVPRMPDDMEITMGPCLSSPRPTTATRPAEENSRPSKRQSVLEYVDQRVWRTLRHLRQMMHWLNHRYRRHARSDPRPQSRPIVRRRPLESNRRKVLELIDRSSFNWKVFLAAGLGMLSASYNLSVSSVISPYLTLVYWPDDNYLSHAIEVQITTLVGALLGSLICGSLADKYGRRKMYGVGFLIMIISSLGLAQTSTGFNQTMDIFGWIIFWRLWAGLGIGGVWTLSAIVTAEFAPTKHRARMLAAVFALQPIGQLVATSVAISALLGIGEQHGLTQQSDYGTAGATVDIIWRLIAGLGGAMALLGAIFRLFIPESPRFSLDIVGDSVKALRDVKLFYYSSQSHTYDWEVEIDPMDRYSGEDPDVDFSGVQVGLSSMHFDTDSASPISYRLMKSYLVEEGRWRHLLGTSLCALLISFASESLGGGNQHVLAQIWSPSIIPRNSTSFPTYTTRQSNVTAVGSEIYDLLHSNATQTLLTISMSSVVASIIAIIIINRISRNRTLIISSCLLGVLFVITGTVLAETIGTGLYRVTIIAYVFCYFVSLGPNILIFMIPAEVFPTRFRGTLYALTAASGRAGAILGQLVLYNFRKSIDYSAFGWTLVGFSALSLSAAYFAWKLIPRVQSKSGIELQLSNMTLEKIEARTSR